MHYPLSFRIALAFIFLIPLFFIPGGSLYLDSTKSALFILGVVLLSLSYLFESYRQGAFSFPRHHFLTAAALLPMVYLLSALLTTPSALSVLGYNLEVGTFGFTLMGSVALLLSSAVFGGTSRLLQALVALFASFTLLAFFMAAKIVAGGDFLSMGTFFGNMGNPLGAWTDLAMAFGLLSVLSVLALGMLPMKRAVKAFLYVVFLLSTALLIVINFSTAFALTLGASALLFFYFFKVEKAFRFHSGEGETKKPGFFGRPTFLPLLLGIISLLLLINPSLTSGGKIGEVISGAMGVQNTDIRPSFSATLGISKAVLSKEGLLGSGPNTFGQDWLIFKPVTVNTTPFWGMAFPFGIGFIPTQVATTGIIGSVLWLIFLGLLVMLAFRAVSGVPESRALRFTLISTLLVTLFLWTSGFVYSPSASMLMLAFIFAGIFAAVAREAGVVKDWRADFKGRAVTRYAAYLLMLFALGGALYLGFVGGKKTLAAYHFKGAVDMANVPGTVIAEIENKLMRASALDSVDLYYTGLSRLNFGKAQAAAGATTGTPEENRAKFEEGLRGAIEGARLAANVNPASYGNWVSLGTVYASLVPAPLNVEGAYENAQFAYNEALKRNPNNPELPLYLAQLEIAKGDTEKARSYLRNSIALKEDYADAYLLLAQLEVRENNISGAIDSAETLATLVPNNPGIHFELGLLKYSSGDYLGAVESLREAVRITPDYANAKYYMGLSFAKLKRVEEAKNQFEDLLVTNPDSEEVKEALKTLESGKQL
jgi:tetratricopeptide (TPR) repeat protein